MPIYDFKCDNCDTPATLECSYEDRVAPTCCDQDMTLQLFATPMVGAKHKGKYGQHMSSREWRSKTDNAKRKNARGDSF